MVIGKTHLYAHGGAGHTSKHVQKLRDWGYEDSHETPGPTSTVDSPYSDYLAEKGLLDVHREYQRAYMRGLWMGASPWETSPSSMRA